MTTAGDLPALLQSLWNGGGRLRGELARESADAAARTELHVEIQPVGGVVHCIITVNGRAHRMVLAFDGEHLLHRGSVLNRQYDVRSDGFRVVADARAVMLPPFPFRFPASERLELWLQPDSKQLRFQLARTGNAYWRGMLTLT